LLTSQKARAIEAARHETFDLILHAKAEVTESFLAQTRVVEPSKSDQQPVYSGCGGWRRFLAPTGAVWAYAWAGAASRADR
jgi:hypothetical protein